MAQHTRPDRVGNAQSDNFITSPLPRPRSQLEVPVFGPTAALRAVNAGARRLELNAEGSYAVGGTTPSSDELIRVDLLLRHRKPADHNIPIRIMIRPRGPPTGGGQDFVYSDPELQEMVRSIQIFKSSMLLRAGRGDGFVFGVLQPSLTRLGPEIHIEANKLLARNAWPFPCVLHRAVDDVFEASLVLEMPRPLEAIKRVIEAVRVCEFAGILTSGGRGDAGDNREHLSFIVEKARGVPWEETARAQGRTWDQVVQTSGRLHQADGAARAVLNDRSWEHRGNPGHDERNVEVIIGGGVRSSHLGTLIGYLDAVFLDEYNNAPRPWYHSSCITQAPTDGVPEPFDDKEARLLVQIVKETGSGGAMGG